MSEPDHDAAPAPPPRPTPASPFSRRGTPAPLAAAAGLVAVQGLVVTLIAIADVVSVRGDRLLMGVTAAVFFLVYGVGLLVCARALNRMLVWSRAPVVLAQLIWLGIAWNFRESPTTVIAVAVAVSSALVLLGVLAPASVAALTRPPPGSDDPA